MPRQRPAEEGLLFDLPLDRPATPSPPARPVEEPPTAEEQPPLPLEDSESEEEAPRQAGDVEPAAEPAAEAPPQLAPGPARRRVRSRERTATIRLRLAAGLTDLGVCLAVSVVLLVALLAQGVRPAPADWPAGAVFLLTFSFLYSVLPLAFWGRTPGMALAGLRATSADGRPLSFRQAVLGWLGGVSTVALAGLPLLLAIGGRSLGDRLGGARTRTASRIAP